MRELVSIVLVFTLPALVVAALFRSARADIRKDRR